MNILIIEDENSSKSRLYNLFKSLEEQVKINIYNKIKNLNEDELNMLSESIDNILKLIPKIT